MSIELALALIAATLIGVISEWLWRELHDTKGHR